MYLRLQLMAVPALAAACLTAQLPLDSLKILTYNAWHGTFLTEDAAILELPSESQRHRELRHSQQLRQLADLRPDLLLLQEVNPLPQRALDIASALDLHEIHKVTDCGIKFFGLGLPININSGLAILARPELQLTFIAVERLSGRWALCGDRFGLQIEEARYALLARITLAGGHRYLVVNTHLHNAPVMPPALRRELAALRATGRLSREEHQAVQAAIEQGKERQRREIDRLISSIRRRTASDPGLAGVILGGDLNAGPASEQLDRLRRSGLVDAARAVDPSATLATSDPLRNSLSAALAKVTRPELPTFGRPALSELARSAAPRKLDYLLISASLESALRRVSLFGLEEGPSPVEPDPQETYPFPLVASDHYGLVAELEPRRPDDAR